MKNIELIKSFLLENSGSEITLKSTNFYFQIKNLSENKRFMNLLLLHIIFKFKNIKIKYIVDKELSFNGLLDFIKKEDLIILENIPRNKISCLNEIDQYKKIIHFSTYTLTFLTKKNQLLLGLKKRGFGKDYYNGFGGKVENNESIIESAKREVFEECSIRINKLNLRAKLYFIFENSLKPNIEGFVFISDDFHGNPKESDEMKPQWFTIPDIMNPNTILYLLQTIPFNSMWEDDIFWLPFFLYDNSIEGIFIFDDNNHLLFTQISMGDLSKNLD